MSTPTSLPQIIKLWQVLGEPNSERFQYLLANGDLLKALLEAGSSLQQVDREAFQTLLHPSLVSTRIGHSVVEAAWAQPSWQSGLSQLPSWYCSPEKQLEKAYAANAQRDWGFAESDFPTVPEDLTKLWLLVIKLSGKGRKKALQRTFDDRWELVQSPGGYTKWRDAEFRTDPNHLRMAPGYDFTPGITWVQFDPEAFPGKSPKTALAEGDGWLAGTEVLDAIWQFPDWPLSWFRDGKCAPNMSALQFRWDKEAAWSHVPFVHRWDGGRQLELYARLAGYAAPRWASAVVREWMR